MSVSNAGHSVRSRRRFLIRAVGMGVLTRLLAPKGGERRSATSAIMEAMLGGPVSSAGVAVSEQSALRSTVVFACVRALAEDIASLPLLVYRRQPGGGKARAAELPLYALLHDAPNPEMTSYEWRSTMVGHLALWGNAYSEVQVSSGGRVTALWPLRPDSMEVERRNGALLYRYRLPGGEVATLPAWRVMHLRGLSGNGITGYSPIRMAMNAIGLALATEEFGGRFFSNGARPGLLLRHPGILSEGAFRRLKESFSAEHEGLSNSHRVRILEEGMDIETVGIPPNEAQFLETRQYQTVDIARIFRMPPHMIGDLERSTFSNIEHQSINYVVHTLRPWLVNMEQAMRRDLLTPAEQGELVIEHLVDGLLRGDVTSRYQAYAIGRQWGWLSANEIRERENMNPVAGGDELLAPLNMEPVGEAQERASAGGAPGLRCDCGEDHEARGVSQETATGDAVERRAQELGDGRRRRMQAYIPIFEDVFARVLRREVADVRRGMARTLKDGEASFVEWLREYYPEHATHLVRALLPAMLSLARQMTGSAAEEIDADDPGLTDALRRFVDDYLESHGNSYIWYSVDQLRNVLATAREEGRDQAEAVEERLAEWEEKRPAKEAHQEAHQFGNAVVVAAFGVMGVEFIRWVARGKSCPYCRNMNGRIVGVNHFFLDDGDEVGGGEGEPALKSGGRKKNPPLHESCDCTVVAQR